MRQPSTGVPLDVPKDTFCSTSGEQSCTFDLRGVGSCVISQWPSNRPATFSIFRVTSEGGGLSHADYVQCTDYTAINCQIRRKIAKDKTDADRLWK